jgi:hypothetical protein
VHFDNWGEVFSEKETGTYVLKETVDTISNNQFIVCATIQYRYKYNSESKLNNSLKRVYKKEFKNKLGQKTIIEFSYPQLN